MELVGFGIFLFAGATWIGVFGAAMKNEKVLRLINAKFGTLFFILLIIWATFWSVLAFLLGLFLTSV